jgi:ribosomal protein L40E
MDMGEAKRRKLLQAIGAEASGGTDTAVYTAAKYDQDAVTRMLAAAMAGNPEAEPRMKAIFDFFIQTRAMHPVCMSCDAEVPIEPPPDLATLAILEPGCGQTPTSGVIIMAICRACDARQTTLAAFEAAVLKATRRGLMSDARLVHLSPSGHA